jgi:chromate transporter
LEEDTQLFPLSGNRCLKSTPGLLRRNSWISWQYRIAINASTFVGTKVAGLSGAIIATAGCVTPSCIIVLILAVLYFKFKGLNLVEGIIKGLRPAVVALIASAGLSILSAILFSEASFPIRLQDIDWIAASLFISGLFLMRKYKINPIHTMLIAGVVGLIAYNLMLA